MISHGVAPSWFHIGVNFIALTIAFVAGIASALAGAASVAWRASRIRAVTALREAAASQRAMTPLRWVLSLAMLAGAVITGITIARTDPEYVVNARKYLAVPLLYVGGMALLAPMLLRPVSRLVTWPLAHVGAGPLIVRQNVLNARRRTSALVTPAVVAVCLMTGTMCLENAGTNAKVEQFRETVHADMVVAGSSVPALPGVTRTAEAEVPVKIGLGGQVIDMLNAKAVPPAAVGTVFTPRVLRGSLHDLGSDFIVIDERTAQGGRHLTRPGADRVATGRH
jgi:putative ABC transport system permease protein